MTLAEIDALIDAERRQAHALLVTADDWRLIDREGEGVQRKPTGGLIYRGLDVWVGRQTRIERMDEADWSQER